MTWGWPQFVLAGLMLCKMGIIASHVGKPKTGSYDFVDVLVGPAVLAWLLYMGGFWTPAP